MSVPDAHSCQLSFEPQLPLFMAEKDTTVRLRRAVKENNLFLVKKLVQRTDPRNPDPAHRRFTSLAWAAVLGHEETFEYLLSAGHDDDELSKDLEGDTILMLLAESLPFPANSYPSSGVDAGAIVRMARMYYDRYPDVLDWSNLHGKTALHIAALKGNEELVRMLLDLGADYDLSDNEGNTPLHYASAWGHIPVVQLLIERGCQYSARNNEGFTPSDYAYSYSTRDTLQDTARAQFELNKKTRRKIYAQAAARGTKWGSDEETQASAPINLPLQSSSRAKRIAARMRSGSGTSRTTATSDSGEMEGGLAPGVHAHSQSSMSASSSPSQPSAHSASSSTFLSPHSAQNGAITASSTGTFSASSPGQSTSSSLHPNFPNPASVLSPIATRMLERDADAMEKYLRRSRSGSQETASTTDVKLQSGLSVFPTTSATIQTFASSGPSLNGDDITSLPHNTSPWRKRLRPSASAAQLRTKPSISPSEESLRSRAGTTPTGQRPTPLTLAPGPSQLVRSSSQTSQTQSSFLSLEPEVFEETEVFMGPPSHYARFPQPEPGARERRDTNTSVSSTPSVGRRLPFNLFTKALPNLDSPMGHRRGASTTVVRGGS